MALLHEILEDNARFVADRERPVTKHPAKRVAVLTCMDTRLVAFLEPAIGLARGDAKVIKNAGATVTEPAGDAVRSLVVAIFALGCAEVLVIGHRDCGMTRLHGAELRRRMVERGVPPDAVDALAPGLAEWAGAFADPAANVRRVVAALRRNPLIPSDVPIHGLVIEPDSGRLELLVDGYR